MAYVRSKKPSKRRNVYLWLLVTLGIGLAVGAFYQWGYKPAAAHDKIHVRFKDALLTEDVSFFEENVEYESELLTRADALRFMDWLNDEKSIRGEAIAEVAQDRSDRAQGMETDGLFRLVDTGEGRFGFADYRIELLPKTLRASADVPLTNIWIDGVQAGRIDETGSAVKVVRMPGRYDVKAVVVVDGETVTDTKTVTLTEDAQLAFGLLPDQDETVAGQFGLERAELIEIEVEAQTGHSIETIEGLMNKRERAILDEIGEPMERGDVWRYEGMELRFGDGRVDRIDIDLQKRPDDLLALLGEPNEKVDTDLGLEWRYDRTLLESIFTFLRLQSEKRFIERDGAMYLMLT
ncbi:hypothetical protein [Exiguobacterium sp. AM39-5BH]|uniref:hypothetical protein n=1 Tax=Exiguobacterium sp. AM39-5BH TaxID=2292355 RepID=UPI000FE21584|nr:hypothetical protein [Exiguobacterium sp. AM39-5BH]RHB48306.1 hypothetical protein DW881_12005 [Exiguobacterium sp. AM39-5BH]